ncbi:hypothetical protein [Escherichia coli]|uniref:hypothetical protein n=1 Tax=Escherichia coli TaxID=562 RepID=UPI00187F9860|nr:hypothetical protein [Escherichia coli]MBE8900104.1 hypothetical protein [Escherichia coli]HAM5260990.1 hypothetical protein [Escherichia coli]
MTIESFFIGTRRSDKRYGPQSKDMQVSEFISLISPKNAPHKVVLPDFTGLASRLDAQIRNQFHQLKEDEHFLRYRQLSERWYQAGSISDRNNRSKRFEKIMDDSLDFLLYSQDVMPNINPDDLQWHDYEKASSKGKMYCVALLFHVIARAAYEPESVGKDPTLPEYCRWMKNWIKKTLGHDFLDRMMIYCALFAPACFPALQRLSGEKETRDVHEFLAEHVRTLAQKNSSEVNYRDQWQFTFGYTMFTKQQFEFLGMMRDVHYRIDCIEQLLLDLIERKVVDFTDASVAGTWIEKQIQRLESNDVKQ